MLKDRKRNILLFGSPVFQIRKYHLNSERVFESSDWKFPVEYELLQVTSALIAKDKQEYQQYRKLRSFIPFLQSLDTLVEFYDSQAFLNKEPYF